MDIIMVKSNSKVGSIHKQRKNKNLGIKPDGYVLKDKTHTFYEYLGEN